jgi:hypothetical protein
MHDDVQYFPSGSEFPWANTQAATQRARMSAMGEAYGLAPMPTPAGGSVLVPPPSAGALAPVQQNILGRPTDVNASPLSVEPPPPAPGGGGGGAPEVPPPGGGETAPPDTMPR